MSEMQEERGVDIIVDRLVWIVENFSAYDDSSHHKLGLHFLMQFQKILEVSSLTVRSMELRKVPS